ncbi:RHS repeat-associated protein [Microvirga lupini]|uniref:RHS repeat-associated protein n=1 Tax=Microvirga lupini TaxID=420324 RepID=A0A7W4VP58_9HYPH|nr:toxin TcdB middle/N-terminal domain-containing protein [Microvirga lupini]MBB3020769.1 RHS repeat-associated protein [Microvirga lupini]
MRISASACVLVLGCIASAQADPVTAPSGAAAGVFGSSVANQAAVEPVRGTLTYSYRFEMPAARGLAQPSLALTYRSTTGDSDAGYGWSLDLPSIEVSPLSGWPESPPNGAAIEERFAANGEALVAVCTTGAQMDAAVPVCSAANIDLPSWAAPQVGRGWVYYRAQTDTDYTRYFLSPDRRTWRAQRKGGILQEFGAPLTAPELAREALEERDGTIYRWRLVRALESARPENLVVYAWDRMGQRGLLYLTDIWDTPRAREALQLIRFAHHTQLTWESQPFSTASYAPLHKATPDMRLARVATASADWEAQDAREVTRIYRLGYYFNRDFPYDPDIQAPLFHRSFLSQINREGRCRVRETQSGSIPGGAECQTLPAVTFKYQGSTFGGLGILTPLQGGPPNLDVNYGVLPYLSSASVLDFNRDGLPDVVQSWEAEPQCFNAPGAVRILVERNDGTADPTLVCYQPGENPQTIRSARPMTGWLNAGTSIWSLALAHQCMDAGDGSPGTVPWFVRQSLPGGPRLANFLTSQGAPTIVGSYGDGVLIWGGGEAGFRPFRAEPVASEAAFCPTPMTSPGWRWTTGSHDGLAWPHSTGAITPEDPVSGPRWYTDIDGDGLIDSLGTGSAQRLNVFLREATPFFSRRYGTDQNLPGGGAGPAQIPFISPGDPVSVVPDKDAPAGTRFFYTDVNGDGLVDLAYFRPSGALVVRPGDGYGRFECQTAREPLGCNGAEYEATTGSTITPWTPINGPSWDDREERFLHDVTGDGLADIITYKDDPSNLNLSSILRLWVNVDGHTFRCADPTGTVPCAVGRVVDNVHNSTVIGDHRVAFADMDGNGVDDVVVLARQGIIVASLTAPGYGTNSRAPHPGLLIQVDNGLGGVTDIRYETIQELMREAAGRGEAWRHVVPVVANVVTRVRTHNNPTANTTLPKPYDYERTTTYRYRDPAYDNWTRSFVGFRQVDLQIGGEMAVTRTTHWFGPCQQDTIRNTCLKGSDNDEYKPLIGLPVRIDRLLPAIGERPAQWLSSTELFYDNRLLFDRRRDVRSAHVTATETYDYDPQKTVTLRPEASTAGDPRMPSPIQDEQIPITVDYDTDEYGNITRVRSHGRQRDGLAANLTGAASLDNVVVTWMGSNGAGDIPGPYRCDPEHWRCFVDRVTITTDQTNDHGYLTERQFRFTYTPQGDLTSVEGWLNAAFDQLNRVHAAGGAVAPLPPGAASGFGWRQLASYAFDPSFGGALQTERPGSPASCTSIRYDRAFEHLPERISSHTNGCTGASLVTRLTHDRGFETITRQEDPSGATTVVELDPFGRVAAMRLPKPDDLDLRSSIEALTFTYTDRAPLSWVEIRRRLGSSDSTIIEVMNGLGERPVRFVEDEGRWVVEGWRETNQAGRSERTYMPFAVAVDPRPLLMAANSPGLGPRRLDFFEDIYGRLATIRENGSTDVASFRYRPHEIEARDAAQLQPGATSYTLLRYDGFDRISEWVDFLGTTDVRTRLTYALTGELLKISRQQAGGSEQTVKTRSFDSMGRLVAQSEPNSGKWTYAWDNGGRLVGTSDPRGCGVNLHYDGMDRLIGEDYSPCAAHHRTYSAPDQTTKAGFEVAYNYDAYEPGQGAADSLFLDDPAFAAGRLVARRDRGSETRFSYDNRGRVRRIDRRLADPTSTTLSYTARRYEARLDYDNGNRLSRRTTGVPLTEFLIGGTSSMNLSYTLRDQVKSVTSSYGSLVQYATYDPDGMLRNIVYGDAAATTASLTYDARRRLERYTLSRNAPAIWSQAVQGYTLPGFETTQTDLMNLKYAYDPVGNPINIEDLTTSTWPAVAAPQRQRTAAYGIGSRLRSIDTQYATPTGAAPWQSPFLPEITAATGQPLPLANAQTRPRRQEFDFDAVNDLQRSADDLMLPFDRSLGTLTNGANGATGQLISASGVRTAFDAAGQLTRLALDRTGRCDTGSGSVCDQWFAFDWDEVGQLSRARRWDLPDGAPIPAAITDVPTAVPTWERTNFFSSGRRLISALRKQGGPAENYVDVLPTLEFRGVPVAGGEYDLSPDKVSASLGGLATVAYDRNGVLPRRTTSLVHTFLHLPDALGSNAITLDRDTSELVERTTYFPFGAVENDYRPGRWGQYRAPNRFSHKQDDTESGLIDFGARFYHPYLGRFMSPDPLVVHGALGNGNPYNYASNRPLGRVDLHGFVTSCGDGCYDFSDQPDVIIGQRQLERAEAHAEIGASNAEKLASRQITAKNLILGTARIPIPGTDRAYFTPNGLRKVTVNAVTGTVLSTLDPLHYADLLKNLGGVDVYKPFMMNVAEDKDDKSQIVGGVGVVIAALAAGKVGGPGVALAAEDAELMQLANQVKNAERFPFRYFRTIAVSTTKEGPILVAGGASDLSAAQIAKAESLGLTAVPPAPYTHAEGTLVFGAGELGLTPVRGVVTSNICVGCASFILEEFGGVITGKRTFHFK